MLLSLVALALAQDAPIDLDAALAIALRDGVDAQEASFARQAAESTLSRRRLASLPNLNVGASVGVGFSGSGASPSTSLSVSSTTPIYGGGGLAADRAAALAALDGARAAEARTRQDLHLALALALLDLSDARARLTATTSTLAAEEALAARIEKLVAAGARTRADQLQQAAAVAKAKAAAIAATRDAAQATLALQEILRLDPAGDSRFTPPAAGPEVAGDFAVLLSQAREGRPELATARASLDAAEANLRGAASGGLPSVDLVVGASTRTSGTADMGAQLGDQAGGSAVLQATVPIFNRGQVRDDIAQARLDRDAAKLAFDAATEAAAYDVQGALVDRDAAAAGAEAADARWTAADAAARVVSDRYDAGAATFAELLSARAGLAEAERDRITAHTTLERARFTLARAVGAL